MLVDRYIARLLKLAGKERSTAYKAIALAEGGIIFLGLIPWLLIRALEPFSSRIQFHWPPLIEKSLVIIGLSFGLFFILWAVWVQLYIGKGTPNLAAPPKKLIIKGPYKLCRNPLQLGVMFYYLGLGSWTANGTDGFLSLWHWFSARFTTVLWKKRSSSVVSAMNMRITAGRRRSSFPGSGERI